MVPPNASTQATSTPVATMNGSWLWAKYTAIPANALRHRAHRTRAATKSLTYVHLHGLLVAVGNRVQPGRQRRVDEQLQLEVVLSGGVYNQGLNHLNQAGSRFRTVSIHFHILIRVRRSERGEIDHSNDFVVPEPEKPTDAPVVCIERRLEDGIQGFFV